MKRISIIVPIYNRERKIKQCLESIINQTYHDIEIILVNDGSTDSSLEVCTFYSKIDKRIKIIDKENSGVSSARNEGIKKATGDYIQFVDSDDYIDRNMCEILMNNIISNNSDIVICGYKTVMNGEVKQNKCINKDIGNILEIKEEFSNLYLKSFFNPPWNKLYKKEVIQVYFDENLNLGEDLIFNLGVLKQCKKITFIEQCLYSYVLGNEDTLTNVEYREERMKIALKIYENMNEFATYFNIEPIYLYGIGLTLINNLLSILQIMVYSPKISASEKKILIREYISNDYVRKESKVYKFNSLQQTLLNFLVRLKMYNFIYYFFKGKHFLQERKINFKWRKYENKKGYN